MRMIFLTAFILAGLGTTLYQVKTGIDERQAELRHISTAIVSTQNDINVLEAEWAFLSRPERIMSLSVNLLDMQPIDHDRIMPLDAIPMRFPARIDHSDRVKCSAC